MNDQSLSQTYSYSTQKPPIVPKESHQQPQSSLSGRLPNSQEKPNVPSPGTATSKIRKRQRELQPKVVPERDLRPAVIPPRVRSQFGDDNKAATKSSLFFSDNKGKPGQQQRQQQHQQLDKKRRKHHNRQIDLSPRGGTQYGGGFDDGDEPRDGSGGRHSGSADMLNQLE